jgi:hypothetical protein
MSIFGSLPTPNFPTQVTKLKTIFVTNYYYFCDNIKMMFRCKVLKKK